MSARRGDAPPDRREELFPSGLRLGHRRGVVAGRESPGEGAGRTDSRPGAARSRGFSLRLTDDGEQQSMLQFDADVAENRRIWSKLPGHQWGLVAEARPAATVWASLEVPPGEAETPRLDWDRDETRCSCSSSWGRDRWSGWESTAPGGGGSAWGTSTTTAIGGSWPAGLRTRSRRPGMSS